MFSNFLFLTHLVLRNNTWNSTMAWNQKNPGVRRILADVRELARDPSDQYAAKPTEENMFEWHFVLRGPAGTDFEGGKYHGKILLPAEYPFKPPNIIFLTPNGRWETKTKICLSMSAYHPEDWQPAWGIRTMLEALISFMPSATDGAVGAMDASSETRKRLALESLSYTHPLMPILPELGSCSFSKSKDFAEAVAQMQFGVKGTDQDAADPAAVEEGEPAAAVSESVLERDASAQDSAQDPAPAQDSTQDPAPAPAQASAAQVAVENDSVDDALRMSSWCILLILFILSYRKLLIVFAPEL